MNNLMTLAGIPLHSISKSFVKLPFIQRTQPFSWILSAAFASSLVLVSSAFAAPMPANTPIMHPASASVPSKAMSPKKPAQSEKVPPSEAIYIVQQSRHAPLVVYKKAPTPPAQSPPMAQSVIKPSAVPLQKKPEAQKTTSLMDDMLPEVQEQSSSKSIHAASLTASSVKTTPQAQKPLQKSLMKPESLKSAPQVVLPTDKTKGLTKNLPSDLASAEAAGDIIIIKTVAPSESPSVSALQKPEIQTPAVIKASSSLKKPVLVASASKTNKHQAIGKFILQYNRNLGLSAALAIADHILKLSEFHKLDYKMVTSLIAVESGFRPGVVSASGAVGLGQLKPSTAKTFGVTNLYDPAQNIKAATGYLRMLTNRYGGSLQHALAAYLMGPGAVKRNGLTPGAQGYIRRIHQKSAQLSMVLKAHGAS
ncbi:MAG: transglycosylase SLT domain-containing protein [Vampirovibrionales bacterium]|nr:transglycosylase SLT domain-containing protein [Vampirovibrionales bacterium]